MMHPDDDTARNIWNEMQRDAAAGAAEEEQQKQQSREEAGLCPMCGDTPINPAIPLTMCVQCAKENEMLCRKKGCINKITVNLFRGGFCSAHAVEIAQNEYFFYLELQSKIEELGEQYNELCDEIGYDPSEAKGDQSSKSRKHNEALDLKVEIQALERDAQTHRSTVLDVREKVGNVFNVNYETVF